MATAILTLFTVFQMLIQSSAQQQQLHAFRANDRPWRASDNLILVSPNRTFAAGFLPSSTDPLVHYFSVWILRSADLTVVWSFAPELPLPASAAVIISSAGVLSIGNRTVGRSNSTALTLDNAGRLEFGNWTSFESPTNTVLANQKIASTGVSLRSLSTGFQLINASTLVFNGSGSYWSSTSPMLNLTTDGYLLEAGNNNKYMTSDAGDAGVLRRLTLDDDGNLRIYSLNSTTGQWRVVWLAVTELCRVRGICDPTAICVPLNVSSTSCVCPPGFRNTTGGACARRAPIAAAAGGGGGKYLRLDHVAFVQTQDTSADLQALNFARCESKCSENTTCVGFSYRFDGGRQCAHYLHNLTFGYWSPGNEPVSFLRVANTETDTSSFQSAAAAMSTTCPARILLPTPPKESNSTAKSLAILIPLFAVEALVGILAFWGFLSKYSKYREMAQGFGSEADPLPLAGRPKRFTFAELKVATGDFSDVIGQGGFGVVYKGKLRDGRVVAVKKLKVSRRGEADFWAEVGIIGRMHHLNLVHMWGFCAERDHRMLVYEYVPNGSLDKHIFSIPGGDDDKVLDVGMRYRIAVGVARAIAYLHEECLEWVLHRDIKPENILLGEGFRPKVSDFGISKLVNKEEMVNISCVRGTRGYLAPEWVLKSEPITAKSDVYSFGMVLLELVTGVRNSEFRRSSVADSAEWSFPGWTFEKVFGEEGVDRVLDPRIAQGCDDKESMELVGRMVKTAMWCLQDRAEARPSMGKVAKMLEGTVEILQPEKPTIF